MNYRIPWLLFSLYLILIGIIKFLFTESIAIDFKSNIYFAPQLLLTDRWHALYQVAHDALLDQPYRYSPLAAFFTFPISWLFHLKIATFIWYLGIASALIGQLWLSLKICRLDGHYHLLAVFSIFFLLLYKLFLSEYKLGQVNIIIGFFILFSFWCYLQKKDTLAGISIFFAVIFKATPVLFLFFYFLQRRWKILSSFAISLTVSVVLFALFFSIDKTSTLFMSWFQALTHIPVSEYSQYTNQSLLSGLIYYFNLNVTVFHLKPAPLATLYHLFYFLFAISIMLVVLFNHKEDNAQAVRFQVALLLMIMVLFSPISWRAHYVNCLFPLIFIYSTFVHKALYKIDWISMVLCSLLILISSLLMHTRLWEVGIQYHSLHRLLPRHTNLWVSEFKVFTLFGISIYLVLFYISMRHYIRDKISGQIGS